MQPQRHAAISLLTPPPAAPRPRMQPLKWENATLEPDLLTANVGSPPHWPPSTYHGRRSIVCNILGRSWQTFGGSRMTRELLASIVTFDGSQGQEDGLPPRLSCSPFLLAKFTSTMHASDGWRLAWPAFPPTYRPGQRHVRAPGSESGQVRLQLVISITGHLACCISMNP
jgi:hypothetical protein